MLESGAVLGTTNAVRYFSPVGYTATVIAAATTTPNLREMKLPLGCDFTGLSMVLTAAPGAGITRTIQLYENTAADGAAPSYTAVTDAVCTFTGTRVGNNITHCYKTFSPNASGTTSYYSWRSSASSVAGSASVTISLHCTHQ